jgi:hypothetical protein
VGLSGPGREIHFHAYYQFPTRLAMFKKQPAEWFPLNNSANRLMMARNLRKLQKVVIIISMLTFVAWLLSPLK